MIYIACSQRVTIADRQAMLDQLIADTELPLVARVLFNISLVENAPNPDEMPIITALIMRAQLRFKSKIAIVNDKVGHATISQLVAVSCMGEVRAFISETNARTWFSCV